MYYLVVAEYELCMKESHQQLPHTIPLDEGITHAIVMKRKRSCRVYIQNEDVNIAKTPSSNLTLPNL